MSKVLRCVFVKTNNLLPYCLMGEGRFRRVLGDNKR